MTRQPRALAGQDAPAGRPAAARNERGVVTAFVAILATGLLMAAALVHDGGQVLARYREATDLARSAARAGAQAVDRPGLDTADVRVDASGARRRVDDYLADAGHPGTAAVTVEDDQVTVRVTLASDTHFLPIGPGEVTATASATAVAGVDEARPRS